MAAVADAVGEHTGRILTAEFPLTHVSVRDGERDINSIIERTVCGNRSVLPDIIKIHATPISEMARQHKYFKKIGGARYFIVLRYGRDESLPLGADFPSFLARLGKHSRRNVRNVRKLALASGLTHEVTQAPLQLAPQLQALARQAHPAAFSVEALVAMDRSVAEQDRGFHAILRLPAGEIVSCCAGWIEDGTAYISYQLNHRDHLARNPSLTNRAFLIEHLIQSGVRELVFIGGCGRTVLRHACREQIGARAWVVRLSPRTLMFGYRYLSRFSPAEIGDKAKHWIALVLGSSRGQNASALRR